MKDLIQYFVSNYGYAGVALIVGLESMGVPLPGETALIFAAIYAGATHQLDVFGVIAAAVLGAVVGDNIGYLVGRRYGMPLLLRHGPRIGIDAPRIKLGRYMFAHYGAPVVFFGRFVALLRTLAALLAGVNQMHWAPFVVANLAGAVVWASVFGGGAYALGRQIHKVAGPIGIVAGVVAIGALVAFGVFVKRHERRFLARAEAEFPGPVAEKP
ncbi:MAG: associated Golgi protein [Hyphomicrobiales bacterium]|nr:associated Golgi protein [Hyphomicrobiales bacterium]